MPKASTCPMQNRELSADSHKGFGELLRGKKLLGLLEELSGEPMFLFKEKINYKLAGSGELDLSWSECLQLVLITSFLAL